MKTQRKILIIFFSIIFLSTGLLSGAYAGPKTFPAGSYIIPVEPCWQPNTDPSVGTLAAYCDTDKEDRGIFQAYGTIYDLLTLGVPVYWMIKPNKTSPDAVDFSVLKSGSGSDPAVTIYKSASKTDTGSLAQVDYIGGPFVVDVNDIVGADYEEAAKKILGIAASGNIYVHSKLHKANYDFTGDVDKILYGVPPKVAVLGEGATQVLLDYLMSSGLGNRAYDIFTQITTPQIIADVLDDFQLLWMPHWIIQDEVPTATDRPLVIGKIRSFLEAGNSGFFECASLESLEGSYDVSKNSTVAGVTNTGFLIDKAKTPPRVETNGGTQDVTKMLFEDYDNFLVQCGGWKYQATGGHVHNFRPNQASAFGSGTPTPPTPDYTYNSTVTRFIHDIDSEATVGYPVGTPAHAYDYYVGGRINGAATQGYVSYLGGHRYIDCNENLSPNPATRTYMFQFDSDLSNSGTVIKIEAVHSACTASNPVGAGNGTCPVAEFEMLAQTGGSAQDDYVLVDADTAIWNADTKTLEDVKLRNRTTNALTITNIYTIFESTPPMSPLPVLNKIDDMTTGTAVNFCAPYSTSPATCPPPVTPSSRTLDLQFDSALINNTWVNTEIVYSGCTPSTNLAACGPSSTPCNGTCPVGRYKYSSVWADRVRTSGNLGDITIDMNSAVYNDSTFNLSGIKVKNASCSSTLSISKINVAFALSPAAKLSTIQDTTVAPATTICSPNSVSTAVCPATSYPAHNVSIRFKNTLATGKIVKVEAVFSGCTQGSTCPKAQITIPNTGRTSSEFGGIKIDMTGANFNSGTKTLQSILLQNTGGVNKTITLRVEFNDSANRVTRITETIGGGGSNTLYNNNSGLASIAVFNNLIGMNGVTGSINLTLAKASNCSASSSISLGPLVTECTMNWSKSNTCGIRYVLNTLFGLQFQVQTNEYSKAQPIVKDNIVYKATFEYPAYKGHLYAYGATSDPAKKWWDAGANDKMPKAGTTNPGVPSTSNTSSRFIFTNAPGSTTRVNFDSSQLATLKPLMFVNDYGTISNNFATAVINSERGRNNASETDPDGDGDISKRLGGIEHSTPALLTRSPNIVDTDKNIINRDRILFVGGHDGMFHAIYSGTYDPDTKTYSISTGGKEIWAYLPSSLLSSVRNQTFTNCAPEENSSDTCYPFPVAVSVDSAPAIGDFYVDTNDDGVADTYKTILVSTATVMLPGEVIVDADGNQINLVNQGIAFALDVTNPYDPRILWERTFPLAVEQPDADGNTIVKNYYPRAVFPGSYIANDETNFRVNMGNSRGSAIGRVQTGTTHETYIFLTSRWVDGVVLENGKTVYGISVYALDFSTGNIKWVTKLIYTGDAEGINETPAIPSLMDVDNNGSDDYVIIGDMQGRLWTLKTNDGTNVSSDPDTLPAYTVKDADGNPTGSLEPIGATVSVYRQAAVFGTGGRDSLSGQSTYNYRIFGVGVTTTGADLLHSWKTLYPNGILLQDNEKVWSAPLIDSAGTIFIGTGIGYTELGRPDVVKTESSGRLLVIDDIESPDQITPIALDGAVVGGIDIDNSHAYLITFAGTVYQFGDPDNFNSSTTIVNPFRTLWWRKL